MAVDSPEDETGSEGQEAAFPMSTITHCQKDVSHLASK